MSGETDKQLTITIHVKGPFTITIPRSIKRWIQNRRLKKGMKNLLTWFDHEDELNGYNSIRTRNGEIYAVVVVKTNNEEEIPDKVNKMFNKR